MFQHHVIQKMAVSKMSISESFLYSLKLTSLTPKSDRFAAAYFFPGLASDFGFAKILEHLGM